MNSKAHSNTDQSQKDKIKIQIKPWTKRRIASAIFFTPIAVLYLVSLSIVIVSNQDQIPRNIWVFYLFVVFILVYTVLHIYLPIFYPCMRAVRFRKRYKELKAEAENQEYRRVLRLTRGKQENALLESEKFYVFDEKQNGDCFCIPKDEIQSVQIQRGLIKDNSLRGAFTKRYILEIRLKNHSRVRIGYLITDDINEMRDSIERIFKDKLKSESYVDAIMLSNLQKKGSRHAGH